ncbi:MAG: hypothetical protein LBS54_01240 [Dysgonamonadaceae bacterium]|jgi:hypothetical protein|nr:hypothetical protein [Dysgonamonadaceae bacterium]
MKIFLDFATKKHIKGMNIHNHQPSATVEGGGEAAADYDKCGFFRRRYCFAE